MCASVRNCSKESSGFYVLDVIPPRNVQHRRCWVPNCENSTYKEALKTQLYGFPRDSARCREWLKAVGDADLAKLDIPFLTKFRHICKNHFLPSEIKLGRARSDAVPQIFKDPRPPLRNEQLRKFDERYKNVNEPIDEVIELEKSIFGRQCEKPPDISPPPVCEPAPANIIFESLGVQPQHIMLPNTDSLTNLLEDMSSSEGDTNFILPRITQVQSLANTILPTNEETYNVNTVIKPVEPTYDVITPLLARDSLQNDSSQKEKEVLTDNGTIGSVIEALPQNGTVQYLQQNLQQNSLNASQSTNCLAVSSNLADLSYLRWRQILPRIPEVISLAPASGSAPQTICKLNTLQETSKVATSNDFQQTPLIDISSSVCKPSLTKPRIILLPHSQGGAKRGPVLIPNKTCNSNSPSKIQEVPSTLAPPQIVGETENSSICTSQRKKRKCTLVPRHYDETLPTYTSSMTVVSPPEETYIMPLQHKTQPQEMPANDVLGGNRKAEDGKCQNPSKTASGKCDLPTLGMTSNTSCVVVILEEVEQRKETVTQQESMQPQEKGTSQKKKMKMQKKKKKNVHPITNILWRTTNFAVKEKWRQRRATGKQKNKINLSTASIWKTINAVEDRVQAMKDALNEKQKQDEEAMEKRWNRLDDRVNRLIEEKVEKTVNQIIEYQLEKRVNEIIEKNVERKDRKTPQDPMEKRISKILETKMEKIEHRVTEVVDKKMDLVLQCVKSLAECQNRTKNCSKRGK